MANPKEQIEQDRKFLHDLATPLTVTKMLLKKMQSEYLGKDDLSSPQKQLERIKQMLEAVEKIERAHAEHRSLIHKRETP